MFIQYLFGYKGVELCYSNNIGIDQDHKESLENTNEKMAVNINYISFVYTG